MHIYQGMVYGLARMNLGEDTLCLFVDSQQ